MAEELGKIEKPKAEEFKKGRKIYFVPLLYSGREAPPEYIEKMEKYWQEVEAQIVNLEIKLGKIARIFHELISEPGEDGLNIIKSFNAKSYDIVRRRIELGGTLEAIEETDQITEFMDWSRCLSIGLQNEKVMTTVFNAYKEVHKKRLEHIAKRLSELLKEDEIGLLLMAEDNQIQFPSDVQVFYVAPPALDELKRWLRTQRAKEEAPAEETKEEKKEEKGTGENK